MPQVDDKAENLATTVSSNLPSTQNIETKVEETKSEVINETKSEVPKTEDTNLDLSEHFIIES